MYEAFFRLDQPPFGLTPDPRFLLRARAHQEALAAARWGLDTDKGLVLVVGDVGTGKTTLCRALLEALPPEVESALILNPYVSDVELLGGILDDLGVPRGGGTRAELVDTLGRHLLAAADAGRRVVVLVDEAQLLSIEALEQVRVLTTLETATRKLLQVVLVGQPELEATLAQPALRQLDQRIGVRCRLRPLTGRETARYVEHRLRVAGLVGAVPFTRAVLHRVWEASRGVPRVINLVCDRALAAACQDGAGEVTAAHVDAAAAAVRGAPRRRAGLRGPLRLADGVTIAAGLLAAVILTGATVQAWRHGWPLPVVSLFTGPGLTTSAVRSDAQGGAASPAPGRRP